MKTYRKTNEQLFSVLLVLRSELQVLIICKLEHNLLCFLKITDIYLMICFAFTCPCAAAMLKTDLVLVTP